MPRKSKAAPPPAAISRAEPGFRSVPVEGARELVTLGPDHPCWKGIPFGVDNAIVWLVPPETTTDEELARVIEYARGSGATAVRVERRRTSKVVLPLTDRRPHLRARDVVIALARAATVREPEKLAGFCEQVMGRCGL